MECRIHGFSVPGSPSPRLPDRHVDSHAALLAHDNDASVSEQA